MSIGVSVHRGCSGPLLLQPLSKHLGKSPVVANEDSIGHQNGDIEFDLSQEATLLMSDDPDNDTAINLVTDNHFQSHNHALRTIWQISWAMQRPTEGLRLTELNWR